MKLKRDDWRSGIFSVSIRNPPKKSRSSDEPSQVEKVATLLLMKPLNVRNSSQEE